MLSLTVSIPQALGSLPNLQLVQLGPLRGQPQDQRLPAGPWLRSLRWLAADWGVLAAASPAVLSGAEALQCICLAGFPRCREEAPQAWDAFWRWAATHPPLHLLGVRSVDETGQRLPAVSEAKKQLNAARPLLAICGCARDRGWPIQVTIGFFLLV